MKHLMLKTIQQKVLSIMFSLGSARIQFAQSIADTACIIECDVHEENRQPFCKGSKGLQDFATLRFVSEASACMETATTIAEATRDNAACLTLSSSFLSHVPEGECLIMHHLLDLVIIIGLSMTLYLQSTQTLRSSHISRA